jgi:hypothetical protein
LFKKAVLKEGGILIRVAQDVEIIKPWIKVGESKSEYEVDGYP